MASKAQKFLKQQQDILEDMKRVAKGVNKSIAQLAPWTPFEEAEGNPLIPDDRIFINSRYQVCIRMRESIPPFGLFIEMSIKTRDRAPYHDWRDFQRIKNELIGEEYEAVELYPAEKRLVDTANQYFIFVFPELQFSKGWFPFGFAERLVSEVGLPGIASMPGMGVSEQRPFEVKPPDLETPETFKKRIDDLIKRKKEKNRGEQAIPDRSPEEMARRDSGEGQGEPAGGRLLATGGVPDGREDGPQ